jgi:hypothetical protein
MKQIVFISNERSRCKVDVFNNVSEVNVITFFF